MALTCFGDDDSCLNLKSLCEYLNCIINVVRRASGVNKWKYAYLHVVYLCTVLDKNEDNNTILKENSILYLSEILLLNLNQHPF